MLCHSFIHLPGIGARRERALWDRGILGWEHFLTANDDGQLRENVYRSSVPLVRQSLDALNGGDPRFFHGCLPHQEAWRLYLAFAHQALFLDIETTGLSPYYSEVTVIGAFGGGKLALFVNGVNLDELPAYVAQFPLLVTFNGSQFDVPFLQTKFPGARLDHAYIDLRFVLASLGYCGGLKALERSLGLHRDRAIEGVDGFEAVRLWHCYRRGDRSALEKLILYNLTDVVNMVDLLEIAVKEKRCQAVFPGNVTSIGAPSTTKPEMGYLHDWVAQFLVNGAEPRDGMARRITQ
jgi:uncharacterized protein